METVRIRHIGMSNKSRNDLSLNVRKDLKIADLLQLISENLGVEISEQKLYFGGKELTVEHTVKDYKINNNDVIHLRVKNDGGISKKPSENCSANITNIVRETSLYYQTGDAVDVIYKELGAWFEAKIHNVFVDQKIESSNEEDLLFQVVMDREEQTAPILVKFNEIRPRAKYFLDLSTLSPNMVVFVNYNTKKPNERGYWYDCKITEVDKVKKNINGTLILGTNHENIPNCRIKFIDEIMKIEKPTPLSERTTANEFIPLRKLPLYCKKCKDVSSKDCKECSCNVCGKKNFIDKLIICDECDNTYHLFCLEPPLLEIPEEPEWYCPDCKIDENEIVKAGESLEKFKNKNQMEKPNLYQTQQTKFFGPIPGIDVGTRWTDKTEICDSGIHTNKLSNIDANLEGVCSIILEDPEEIYYDNGNEFYYNIFSSSMIQQRISANISITYAPKVAKLLTLNCDIYETCNFGKANIWRLGKPIRVVRSSKTRNISKFAPKIGYRYDGVYKVVEYFPIIDSTSFIWRFLMRRHDWTPPPWHTIKSKFIPQREANRENPNKKLKLHFKIASILSKSINQDRENEKLWEECTKVAEYGEEEFVRRVKETFTCVCCQEVVYLPVTTNCKHNVCYDCLKKCFYSDIDHCPSCRLNLDKKILQKINWNLHGALKLIVPGYGFHR